MKHRLLLKTEDIKEGDIFSTSPMRYVHGTYIKNGAAAVYVITKIERATSIDSACKEIDGVNVWCSNYSIQTGRVGKALRLPIFLKLDANRVVYR